MTSIYKDGRETINAATIYAAVLAAADVAPVAAQVESDNIMLRSMAHGIGKLYNAPCGFEPGSEDQTNYEYTPEYCSLIESLQAMAYSEVAESVRVCAPSHITFKTGAHSSHRIVNTSERLTWFANTIKCHAKSFGGGLARIVKPRAATTWPANSVSLFKQLIEDQDYSAALDLAEDKLGAVFYPSGLMVAPVACDAIPGTVSGMDSNGAWAVYEPTSGLEVGSLAYRKPRTRAAAVAESVARVADLSPDNLPQALAKAQAQECDHEAARADWMAQHELADERSAAQRIKVEAQREADYQAAREQREAERSAQADQDVAQVLASAQAAATIEQAQTVTIEQTEQAGGSDARRELVTCELGASNAQGVTVGSAAGGFTVAAYDRIMGALNGFAPPPASPAPGVGGVFHSNLESEPAKNPTAYCLPAGRVHDGWAACKSADFTPDARQQLVMDAVSIALGEGLFYTKDVLARCVDLLSINANTQAIRSERVEGGDVGMDVYYARQAVEAKAANQASREIAGALNLHVGDVLGTLVFSDYKRCTGVTIAAISETGLCFTISGKRGTSTVSGDVGADNLKQSINRAHEKGLRKTNFEQFAQGRQPVEPENCAAAEVTATPAAGVCTSAPARQAQNAAPVSSGQFKSKTDGVSGELKTPAAQDAGGVSSGQFKKKNEAAAAGFDATAAAKPTIKGKSGKWRAWFATTKKGKLILDFESNRIRVCDAHDTASARMAALTALAQQADFVPPNPPEKPGGREGSFVQNSKPVSPEPAASPAGGLSITLTRAEGNCETDSFEPVTVASFAAADALLHGWSETAPAKGGYNKCDFSIVWPDGGSYEGRYDLKHHSIEPASLSAHMIDQAEYQTGKFCPLHMSAAAYAQRMAETSDETRAVYAEILATMASLGAYFPKLRPVALDLRALVAAGAAPAALVGLGVSYCGDCCNASGRGAIVATGKDEYYGLVVDVVLEDGREHRQTRAANFGDGIGARYRLDGKQHGAPYLAQLAGAVATAKAQASATKEQADKAHAQALIDLAAQHPQLKRYTPGVKLGGVTLAAANVRILLREAFPGVKFSVKTSKFSGGDDLRVSWTDGPTDKQVDAIVSRFDRGHFDGQDDSYTYTHGAFTELFGDAKYSFTERQLSDSAALELMAQIWPDASTRPALDDWHHGRAPVLDASNRNRVYLASIDWTRGARVTG